MTSPTTIADVEISVVTDLDFLIGPLRRHLGDITSPYTYSDGFLRGTLVDGLKALTERWQNRYLIDSSYVVTRNSATTFVNASPPVIQDFDERPLVLMASIIIKTGVVQSISGSLVSWRDDEISLTNISSGSTYLKSLENDILELNSLLPTRENKLARARKQSLLGFNTPFNTFEGDNYRNG